MVVLLVRASWAYPRAITQMRRAARHYAAIDFAAMPDAELVRLAETIGNRQAAFGPALNWATWPPV
jgi:hypothetical protein